MLTSLDIVQIVDKPNLHLIPSQEDKILFDKKFQQQLIELKQVEDDYQMTKYLTYIDKVAAGYSKSKKRKGEHAQQTPIETEEELKQRLISNHKTKLATTPMSNRLIQIPSTHYLPSDTNQISSVEVLNNFQSRVFIDLWHRGYTMTAGETFGGNFLCYPGDPLHYHASHILICCEKGLLNFNNVLKYARSSVIVNKNCVFAYQNDQGLVKYQSLEWISASRPVEETELKSS